MNSFRRSMLNVLRSPGRSAVVMIILAVSLALALIMFEVYAATSSQLNSINGAVGNDITVRPAGYSAFGGGGNPLPQAQANQLSSLPHVKSVQESVNTIYSGDELASAIIPPPGAVAELNGVIVSGSTPPIMVIGIDPSDTSPALTSGGTITMVTGRYFTTEDAEADVVLVVRQRVKEIGIMKAIGVSNWQIGFQFSLETAAISVVATILGVFISVLFGQRVANSLVGPAIVNGNGIGGIVGGTIGGIRVAVSPDVKLIAFGTAVILAIIASMIPVWYIARVRPADVLRNE